MVPSWMLQHGTPARLHVHLRVKLLRLTILHFLPSILLRLLAAQTRQIRVRVRVSRLKLEQRTLGRMMMMVMMVVMDLGRFSLL